jgi:hypothetical protein
MSPTFVRRPSGYEFPKRKDMTAEQKIKAAIAVTLFAVATVWVLNTLLR